MQSTRWSTGVVVAVAVTFGTVIGIMAWGGDPFTADKLIATMVTGVATGSIYAIAAAGLVVTYTTSGIFNFAQGAMGMIMAFVFWELKQNRGLPTVLALVLVIFVVAPLAGAVVERLLMRDLLRYPLVVRLVVTIGLMLFLMGLAATIWDPSTSREFPHFFGTNGFKIGDTTILWHRFLTIVVGLAIALGLRLLLYRTRMGTAMRAVVDNRELAALNGARPARVSALAWALGTSMAAIAGILIAPETTLVVDGLTLLIIDAFAAAILGRLRSLPLTYAGALALGLLNAFAISYLQFGERWFNAPIAIPTIFLGFVLLALPQSRIEPRQFSPTGRLARVPKVWEAALGVVVLFGVVALVSGRLGTENLNRLTVAMITSVVLLSLVPLTGWSGQVSLMQITFMGVGAWVMGEWFGDGSVVGLLVAALIAIPVGVLVAAPALRLDALYLALWTMAVARIALVFFSQPEVFGNTGVDLDRVRFLDFALDDQRSYLLFVTGCFAVLSVLLVVLRRSRYGRRLIALRDSPAAAATLGVNLVIARLGVFALSAAIAAVAGALLGMQRGVVSAGDFDLVPGLAFLLLVVVGGVSVTSGALFGGMFSQFLIVIRDWLGWAILAAIETMGPGLAAFNVTRNPEGAAVDIGRGFSPLLPWRKEPRTAAGTPLPTRALGVTREFTPADVRALDDRLGLPSSFRYYDGHDPVEAHTEAVSLPAAAGGGSDAPGGNGAARAPRPAAPVAAAATGDGTTGGGE